MQNRFLPIGFHDGKCATCAQLAVLGVCLLDSGYFSKFLLALGNALTSHPFDETVVGRAGGGGLYSPSQLRSALPERSDIVTFNSTHVTASVEVNPLNLSLTLGTSLLSIT